MATDCSVLNLLISVHPLLPPQTTGLFPPCADMAHVLLFYNQVNSRTVCAMDQLVQNMPMLYEITNTVEVVVHISENLKGRKRNNLVVALEEEYGIASAEFCSYRHHLMLVKYDSNMYSSQDVLASVKSHNVNARLMARYNW